MALNSRLWRCITPSSHTLLQHIKQYTPLLHTSLTQHTHHNNTTLNDGCCHLSRYTREYNTSSNKHVSLIHISTDTKLLSNQIIERLSPSIKLNELKQQTNNCIAVASSLNSKSIALYHALWNCGYSFVWLPTDAEFLYPTSHFLAESAAIAVITTPQLVKETSAACEKLGIPYFVLCDDSQLLTSNSFELSKNETKKSFDFHVDRVKQTPCRDATHQLPLVDESNAAIHFYSMVNSSRCYAAVHSHQSVEIQVNRMIELFKFSTNDVVLQCIPPTYVQGMIDTLHAVLRSGGSVVLMEKNGGSIWEQLSRCYEEGGVGVTVIALTRQQACSIVELQETTEVGEKCIAAMKHLRLIVIANEGKYAGPGTHVVKRFREYATNALITQVFALPEIGSAFMASSGSNRLSTRMMGSPLTNVIPQVDPRTNQLQLKSSSSFLYYKNRLRSTNNIYDVEHQKLLSPFRVIEENGCYSMKGMIDNEFEVQLKRSIELPQKLLKPRIRDEMNRHVEGYVNRINLKGSNWSNLHRKKRHWKNK